MKPRKSLWLALATAPALAALLAVPGVSAAKTKAHAKHFECEVTKDGKTTTQAVKDTAECTKLGGKIVPGSPGSSAEKKKTQ